MNVLSLVTIPILLFVLAVPLCIGILVYQDARQRDLPAILWALVAALAPSMIGLIAYLIIRSSRPSLRCPHCGAPVSESDLFCRRCSQPLHAVCPSCQTPVQPQWKVCPMCAAPLPDQPEAVRPVPGRNRSSWVLVLLGLLCVLVILVLLIIGILTFSRAPGSVQAQSSISSSRYIP